MTTRAAIAIALDTGLRDLRHALLLCRRAPGFAAVVVLSIALGSGATTAIFQLIDAVRLRTLPVRAPDQLVQLRIDDMTHARGTWLRESALTNPLWEEIRTQQHPFSEVFAWADEPIELSSRGELRKGTALWVSGGFFQALGVEPLLGRVFSERDDRRGCGSDAGVVISYPFWQREFGGDPAVVGRTITLGRRRTEVIGITPREFFGLEVGRTFDVVLPICAEPAWDPDDRLESGTVWWLTVMGRLKPGVPLANAAAALQTDSASIFRATLPANYPTASVKPYLAMRLVPVPAARGLSKLREQYLAPLLALLVITGLVLSIACMNLAHLMLARTTARRHEIAVRVAIGASRWRLAAQLINESLLLAACGVTAGLLISRALTHFLVGFLAAGDTAAYLDISLDVRTFLFAAAVALMTTAIFAAAPTLRTVHTQPVIALKSNTRTAAAATDSTTVRRLLLASQIALSLALLAGTLLFVGTLRRLRTVDPGFQPNGVVITTVSFKDADVPPERAAAFRQDILERVRSSPGVAAAAEVAIVPLSENWNNRVWMDGSDPADARVTFRNMVGTDYFRAMGVTLLAGRDFTDQDMRGGSERVAIVNEEFERQIAPGESIVGRYVWIEPTPYEPSHPYRIIGLVRNAAYLTLRQPFEPEMFVPTSQTAAQLMTEQIVVRSQAPASTVISALRNTLDEAGPTIRYSFRRLDTVVDESLMPERLMAAFSMPFAVLAIVLTALGLYGVTSYVVARRGNEISIRMALGADQRAITALIVGETAAVLVVGLAGGGVLTLAGGRAVSALLYDVQSYDVRSVATACAAIAAVALGAAYLPARRAATLDLMTGLRQE